MIETIESSAALAREAQMLGDVASGRADRHLWFWQAPQSLVAPRNLAVLPAFEPVAAQMAERGWPVAVRATGGDVVPQGPGIVNVSHVYLREAGGPVNIAAEYEALCAPLVGALGQGASVGWQAGAFCDGAYNVQYQSLKFAGTAMRFRPCKGGGGRHAILAHALMLFEPPSEEAIETLNVFLSAMGQGRVIDRGAHCGLPDGVSAESFVARVRDAFASME